MANKADYVELGLACADVCKRGDEFEVTETLMFISRTNWLLRLHKEGIQRAEEALGIYERLDNTTGQARACVVVV